MYLDGLLDGGFIQLKIFTRVLKYLILAKFKNVKLPRFLVQHFVVVGVFTSSLPQCLNFDDYPTGL